MNDRARRAGRLRSGLDRALQGAKDALAQSVAPARPSLDRAPPGELAAEREPPVVARVVIEVRSDGTQTIARGALEGVGGQADRVAIEARGTTPAMLAAQLARAIAQGLILGTGERSERRSTPGARLLKKTR